MTSSHGETDGAGPGCAEGVEILHAVVERGRDLTRRDDCGEWMTIADRLAHG